MRSEDLPFAQPDFDEAELIQVREALESGWVTTGPKTQKFETEFASFVGSKHAVAVNSCTAAMHLALEAIGLGRGDEVITTPYTFAATAEVVRYFDAKPVLVDVRASDFNVDPDLIEAAVSPRTRAIIPVHIAGLPADLDRIGAMASKHGLAVVEDAAHALPTTYRDRTIGRPLPQAISHAVCFSFYATKSLTTGEGGMICTDDTQLAERCRVMALHGMSRDAWDRYSSQGSWFYDIVAPGFKYNMTDIAAGMGLAQLGKVERMAERRRSIAMKYSEAFADLPELEIPFDPEFQALDIHTSDEISSGPSQHAWHLYMLRLNLELLRIDRHRFMELLKDNRIGASVHFIPLHLHPYYRNEYGYQPSDFPVADREYRREVSLPIYSRMSEEDVSDVISAVRGIVQQHRS